MKNRLLQTIVAGYSAVWVWAAWRPLHRSDWLLENLLVFAFAGTLVATYRRFRFSDRSYVLMALFLALHTIGSHYTYAKTPIGYWLQDAFGLSRNPYDRVVHFAFGLLLAEPLRELIVRVGITRGFWSYALAVNTTLSFSAVYEILEWIVAILVAPELGSAFLGTQGDEWDAQKDSALAGLGAILAMAAAAAVDRARPARQAGHPPS